MALRDQPYLPLYVQDFMTDEKLAECSATATGVYIRIMCVMHKSEVYGTVVLSGKDIALFGQLSPVEMFAKKLMKHLPFQYEEVLEGLTELIDEKVLHINGTSLCQKRMMKDNHISEVRSASGKKGADKKHSMDFAKAKEVAKPLANGEQPPKPPKATVAESPELSFEAVWNLYDKKVGDKRKLQRKWGALSAENKRKVIEYIPKYIASQPDKQYRKNFETFLNNQGWEDEIINDKPNGGTTIKSDIPPTQPEAPRDYSETF